MPDERRYEASCPQCGSTNLRERNIAEAWAKVGDWRKNPDGSVTYEGDYETGFDADFETADEDSILCYDCDWRGEPDDVRLVPLPVWLPEDSVAATADGWDVFNAHKDDGEYDAPQVQRDDEAEQFIGDGGVWQHLWPATVHERELQPLHLKALAVVVFADNRDEIKQIARALGMRPEQFVNGVRNAWYHRNGAPTLFPVDAGR